MGIVRIRIRDCLDRNQVQTGHNVAEMIIKFILWSEQRSNYLEHLRREWYRPAPVFVLLPRRDMSGPGQDRDRTVLERNQERWDRNGMGLGLTRQEKGQGSEPEPERDGNGTETGLNWDVIGHNRDVTGRNRDVTERNRDGTGLDGTGRSSLGCW